MKRKADRKQNKGFTLVELIVAIAILSIVVGAVMVFFMRIINGYHGNNAESDLQNEAQMSMAQLETLVINASQGVGLKHTLPASQMTDDEFFIYNRYVDDASGLADYKVTHIYYDQNEKKIKYCYMSYVKSGGVYSLTDDKQNSQTLSNYVDSFSVDLSNLASGNRVGFSINYKGKNNRKYSTQNTVLLRNKVINKTNGETSDYYQEVIAEDERAVVTALELSPKEFYMWTGTSTACPFTATFKRGDTVTDEGTAVWNFDPLVTGGEINHATGAIRLDNTVRGDLTVRATEQGSIQRGGMNDRLYVSDTATVHVKSAEKDAVLTIPAQPDDNLSVATATFTIHGQNLTQEDLGAITPVVTADSSRLSVSIAADPAASDFSPTSSKLCYTVRINRPTNYLGKKYELAIHAAVPGNQECISNKVEWSFRASDGDEDKVVSAVKLADTSGRVNSEAGSVSVAADRGDELTMVMYVKYKDKDGNETEFMPLGADAWSIEQSGTASVDSATCSIVPGSSDYTLFMNAEDYTRDFSMDFTTKYSDGQGQELTGPSVHFTFSRVQFSVKNILGNQSVFPVTSGKTQQIQFEVQGLKNASVYVKEGTSTGISVTASGQTASVAVRQNTSVDVDYTFGLRDSKGHVLNGVTCTLTIWPDKANTTDGIYIPSVSDISNFDPTKDAPEAGRQTTIFMPDGERVTYRNQPRVGVDGETHRYWAEYNGKTYYWVSNLRRWVLNE